MTKRKIEVRIEIETFHRLEEYSKETDRTLSDIVRELLEEGIKSKMNEFFNQHAKQQIHRQESRE